MGCGGHPLEISKADHWELIMASGLQDLGYTIGVGVPEGGRDVFVVLQQKTVIQWVFLRQLLEVCTRGTGYTGGG